MRAILGTEGSTGDLMPFIALAAELRRHGHTATFALPPHLRSLPERFGFQVIPLGADISATYREIHAIQVRMQTSGPRPGDTERLAVLWAPLVAALPRGLRDLSDLCRDADVLIALSGLVGRTIHDVTHVPYVSVATAYPYDTNPTLSMTSAATLINAYRKRFGVPPLLPTDTAGTSPQLALFAISPQFLQPRPGWPRHYRVPGFFFVDHQAWEPDPALAAFLAVGPPPIIISLGSMIHDNPAALTELFVDAVQRVGCRAIIQHGWSSLATGAQLPAAIHPIDFVPHDWLFPRLAGVIHHGGAGTTAAVFRSGIPSVFIPHGWDQPIWARFGVACGAAAADIIPYGELTAERLSAAITTILGDARYRQAAVAFSEKLRAERGVQQARVMIEQLAATSNRG